MSSGVGSRLKAVAVFLAMVTLLSAGFTGTLVGIADANASLRKIVTTPPNSWELPGADVNGSVTKFIVDTMGWNVTKMVGNVGLGNGSVQALNRTSNQEINYTNDYIMAADVSTAPWDPSRLSDLNMTTGNVSYAKNATSTPDNASGREVDKIGRINIGNMSGNMSLNDAYHPILLGRPVDDMLYEYPHGIMSNVYARLLGFRLPDGSYVNIGIRSLGYGY
jgi:hypothetical protein